MTRTHLERRSNAPRSLSRLARGQPAVDVFMRLYVTPGADHMGMGAPSSVDLLTVLTEWVKKGKTPASSCK